jgi:hypothetical protein
LKGAWLVERGPDIALSRKIVDFVHPRALDDAPDIAEFHKFEIDQFDIVCNAKLMEAAEVGRRGFPHRANDEMALLEQQAGEIGAVLCVDAGNERSFGHANPDSTIDVIVALCGNQEQGMPCH